MVCILCLLAVVEEANVKNESYKQWRSALQAACHPERERKHQRLAELATTWHWVGPMWGGGRNGGVYLGGTWDKSAWEIFGNIIMRSNVRFKKTALTAYLGNKPRSCLVLRDMEDAYI